MATSNYKRQRPDSDDDDNNATTIFTSQENFARFLIIESKNKEKPVHRFRRLSLKNKLRLQLGQQNL